MFGRFLLVLLALVLVASLVAAVPAAPSNIRVKFVGYSSVKIAWSHPGGEGVHFNVYKGSSLADAVLVGSTTENFFVDSDILGGQEYVYFVTAEDSSGEAWPLYSVTIKPTERPEKPFELVLLYPDRNEFAFGSDLELIVGVESPFFYELEGLEAVLVNLDSGERTDFVFDSKKGIFFLSKKLPLEGTIPKPEVAYSIVVTANVAGESFSDSKEYRFSLVPPKPVDFWPIAANLALIFGIPIVVLLVVGAFSFLGWKRSLTREKAKDSEWVELVELLKERSVWKIDALKTGIPKDEYEAKELEFQARQDAIEARLGHSIRGFEESINPFAGFSKKEMDEIVRILREIGSRKNEMTRDQMLAWLVGQGAKEKIANKVAEILYGKEEAG